MNPILPPDRSADALAEALMACESEPIHMPGLIQPHGALLAVAGHSEVITCASANLAEMLGMPRDHLALGSTLEECLGTQGAGIVRHARPRCGPEMRFAVHDVVAANGRDFDLALHVHRDVMIAELVPRMPHDTTEPFLEALQQGLDMMGEQRDDLALLDCAANLVRSLGGLDRVMVYRFDGDWNGEVVAEARRADLEPFLGLHYPASDIPAQARRLYRSNLARYIPDCGYRPVPIMTGRRGEPASPIDLSFATLRSVSPVHLQYLGNMGVRGTLVLSLLVNHELWGLISCHQYSPLALSGGKRRTLSLIAQTLGALIGQATRRAEAEETARLGRLRELILADSGGELASGSFADLIEHIGPEIREALDVSVVVTWAGTREAHLGGVLADADRHALIGHCRTRLSSSRWWATDQLSREAPELVARNSLGGLSGLLAACSSAGPDTGVALLRLEQAREVIWAGAPDMDVTLSEEGYRLSPRRSFVEWRERVRGRSRPWSESSKLVVRELAADHERRVLRSVVEAERRFRAMAEQAPIMIWMEDTARRFVYANRAMQRFLGGDGTGEIDSSLDSRLHAEDRARCASVVDAARQRQVSYAVEYRCRRGDGEFRWIRCTAEPRHEPDGAFSGYLGTLVDISEEREARQVLHDAARTLEERVAQRTSELSDALAELEVMSSAVSHDLAAPLHHMSGFASLLAMDEAVRQSPAAVDFARRIVQSAERMQALIDKLIGNMRLGRVTIDLADVRIADLVHAYVGDVSASLGARKVEWLVRELPTVRCDPVLVRQVVQNLIENAIKYTGRRPNALIEIGPLETAAEHGFFVRDNGVGFDMDHAAGLFGVFRRLHSEREFPGIGIGLANLRRIMQRHGGRVWCEAAPDKGACFFVAFPKRDKSREGSGRAADIAAVNASTVPGSG